VTNLWLLALVPGAVLATALALPGGHRDRLARWAALAPLAALPLALSGPAAGSVSLPWLLLGARLEVDVLGRPLLLVAALVYAAALAGAAQAVEERRPLFTALLLTCWSGNALLVVAADAATFYVGFAVMGLSAYGLVAHLRTPAVLRAGRIYLVMTVLGELAVLAGLLLVVAAGGFLLPDAPAAVAASEHRDLAVVLLLVGFGVKAGLVPLHLWLPLAHPAAPAPASAVLSGCMVKAGLLGMLRFLPLGEAAMPVAGAVVGALALGAAFLAVVVGLTQRDPKANLAYSTVSQMGFHLVLVGVALSSPRLAPGAVAAVVLYAAHHGIAKGALFLGVAVSKAYGGSALRWVVRGGMALAALAVAGAPLTSGAAAKYSAKLAVEDAGVAGLELVVALPLVGIGTTLLLLRLMSLLPEVPPTAARLGPPGLLGSWLLLVLLGAPAVWWLLAGWLPEAPAPAASPAALWDATWPVLAGLALAAVAVAAARRRPDRRFRELPAGDVVVLAEAAGRRVSRGAGHLAARAQRPAGRDRPRRPAPSALVTRAEQRLSGWAASGAGALVLLALLAGAVARGSS
jgi:hydrogenase-4 component B